MLRWRLLLELIGQLIEFIIDQRGRADGLNLVEKSGWEVSGWTWSSETYNFGIQLFAMFLLT